jgi:hypothetical protein
MSYLFIYLLCWVGVLCGIYKSSYNIIHNKLMCICFILNRSILFHFINQIYKVFAPPKILIFPFYNKIYRKFLHAIIFSVSFLLIYSKIVYHFLPYHFNKRFLVKDTNQQHIFNPDLVWWLSCTLQCWPFIIRHTSWIYLLHIIPIL